MEYPRLLQPAALGASAFIFGPRLVGKTTLLRTVTADAWFDLLDPEAEMRYRPAPRLFWEEVAALRDGSRVVVDEIQRIPALLDYVQMGIDRLRHTFLLSGSSARKLRRGTANLLGGRALDLRLHPLTAREMGDAFRIEHALRYGTLPLVASLVAAGREPLAAEHLRSYVTTYVREEVQAEALTRNVGNFQRFLVIAAQANGQIVEFANVSRESGVPASTVKGYFEILDDTLNGFLLWPWHRSERKKARPKVYFFDCGVVRALQNRLVDPPGPAERGLLFETWFVGEMIRLRDYLRRPHTFSFLRDRNVEIDVIVEDGRGPRLGIEIKSGRATGEATAADLFRRRFPGVRFVVASLADPRPRKSGGLEILPWREALDLYASL